MTTSIFISRLMLRNYKSIGYCNVRLGPLTYLVGANGSGKSNFLDALHLVRDALSGSLDNALNERGGLAEVRRHCSGRIPGWQRGFAFDAAESIDAEKPRDAKGWIRARMVSRTYGETTDQPAFSERMNLQLAFDHSRFFRKLCAEWERQSA